MQGAKHGFGIWKAPPTENCSYLGEWKHNKVHGYGVHQWKNGDKYEGQWEDGLKSGKGTDLFANGDSYVGQYKFGLPHGDGGHYRWASGASFQGSF